MPFSFQPFAEIKDVILIEPKAFGDDRGWFMETFKRSDFEKHGIPHEFRQDNQSRSTAKGIVRGLHYQANPMAQGKLVRCVAGAIYDVAVDIRRGSPTYGKWVGVELSADNRRIVWVPPGFAHGVCALTDVTDILYKATAEYSPQHDRGIRWDDPAIGIAWPTRAPILSAKDAAAPLLAEAEHDFTWRGR